jgi:hypothetical protein
MTTMRAPTAAAERHKELQAKIPTPAKSPAIPHDAFLQEFRMIDGRRVMIDKRNLGYACEGKPEDFEGTLVSPHPKRERQSTSAPGASDHRPC